MTLKTCVYIATTLDGFIARTDGSIDWLDHDSKGEDYGWASFRQSLDGVILGRKTYEKVRSFDVEWPYKGLSTWIWSRTLSRTHIPDELVDFNVDTSALEPQLLLEALGQKGLTRVWVDGGQTIQAFLSKGLIDTLTLTRMPVLIGDGVSLFGCVPVDVRLRHLKTQSFASGVVQTSYQVVPTCS